MNNIDIWEFIFIFIAGAIGDAAVHFFGIYTKGTNYEFAQGLLEYYKSLESKLLLWNIGSKPTTSKNKLIRWFQKPRNWSAENRKLTGWIQGAIWGGIACVIALLIAKVFLIIKENMINNQNLMKKN